MQYNKQYGIPHCPCKEKNAGGTEFLVRPCVLEIFLEIIEREDRAAFDDFMECIGEDEADGLVVIVSRMLADLMVSA